MRRFFDWILSRQRGRWFLRSLGLGLLLISSASLWRALETVPLIEAKQQQLRDLYTLEDSVATLQREAGDSLWHFSESQVRAGVFPHWDSAALWLERLRTTALRGNVEIGWEFDSLVTFPHGGDEVFRLPIRLHATPVDLNFETFMNWLEGHFAQTDMRLGLHLLELEGEESGMTSARLQLEGFLRP